MKKSLLLILLASPAFVFAQQNIGTVSIDPLQNTVTCAQATAGNLNATVVGTVTCNAGTNLNTSALAATLATIDADTSALAAAIATFGSTFPATGTAAFSDGTNAQPGRVVDADTGAGTVYVQGVNLLKRASGGPVEAGTASDPLRVDPTGSTTQPVSGTVTANLSATDNAVLDDIADGITVDSELPAAGALADNAANPTAPAIGAFALVWDGATWDRAPGTSADGALVNLGANNDVTVTGSVTANAGTNLNTSALALESGGNLATVAGVVDATGTTVPANAAFVAGTDGTNTRALKTDAGGELQVDVLTMPTTTVTATNLDVQIGGSDTLTVGNVATIGTSVTPGTSAAHLGKAEDAAHTTGDVGVLGLAVRSDAGGVLAGTDGDYTPLQTDAAGALRVTGGGGGTEYTEDAAAAANPVGNASILVREDTTTTAVATTNGDNVAQRGSNFGAAYVTLLDTSGNPVSVGGGTQYDEDTATAAAEKLTMSGVVRQDAPASLVGADQDRTVLSVDALGRLWTNVSTSALPTGAATSANQSTVIGHVDGVEGLLTTIDADTGTIAGAVSGTEMQVDVVTSALPSGASTLAEQQTQTTALQKIDNLAHSGSDVALSEHVPVSGQLDDAATTTVTENQVAPLRITSGRALHVAQQGTVTVSATNLDVQIGGSDSLTIGTFPDNEPFNVSQINGVAPSMGNGASGTGVQRVTIASDSTGQVTANAGTNLNTSALLTTSAHDAALGTAGSADAQVRTIQGIASMTPVRTDGQNGVVPIYCTSTAFLNMTTATTTQIVALSGSTHVYVCSYAIHVGGAADVKLVSGTGTNCATSQADVSTNYDFAAADAGINRTAAGGGVVARTNDAGDALCVTSSAATDVDVEVSYAQF